MTATTVATQRFRRLAIADPATYRRTLHLLLDLPIGIATFTVAVTLLSVSAALFITLVGLPLLMATLYSTRWLARFERARAHTLLGVEVPPNDATASARGWRRLTDPAAWRAVGYAVVMLPVGIVTSVTAITGWSVALAMFAYPAYQPFADHSSRTVGSANLGAAGWQVATSVTGFALLLVMPTVVRALAALDATVVRRLLGGSATE